MSSEIIIENWKSFRYHPWHINRQEIKVENDDEDDNLIPTLDNFHEDVEEWKILSRLIPPNNIYISDLQTLGRRDSDRNYN